VLEYSSTVWDPHTTKEISQIEKIQRNAARFVKNDYSRHSSVTQMMSDLNWKSLESRRRDSRLILLFKIINNLVAIPPDKYLERKNQNYNLRNPNQKQYQVKSANVDSFKFSFFPRSIKEWNNLSEKEVSCPSVNTFRAAMQQKI
jgi:hypothetical protein